ncbi:MAG: trimethylamine methyltransferase family protein, partial [Candidatus Bathyarchaeia archaeon]
MRQPLESQGIKLDLLDKDQLYEIHLATLDILERIGVGIYEDRALKLMDEAGAIVDYDKKVVKIPQQLLKELIEKAPEVVTLYARNPKHSVKLEPGGKTYFNNSSYGIKVYDLDTGMHRDS